MSDICSCSISQASNPPTSCGLHDLHLRLRHSEERPAQLLRMMNSDNGNAEFCGSAHTVERFPLVIAGKYNIPFLLNVPGSGHQVTGEVYHVDLRMRDFLDEFEQCPDWYQRTVAQLEVQDWVAEGGPSSGTRPTAGSIIEAFVYSINSYPPEWLKLPFYDNYDAHGSHGLKHVAREDRD
ncbi:hypothetical protein GJAV_G00212590 [Gymnothorax javanicus]|nr:hypothetical protein GJAV_G00212590 [Gymnothorax javanicus]